MHKKLSSPLRISSVNKIKSKVSCGFSHIYWRNPYRKFHFLCSKIFSFLKWSFIWWLESMITIRYTCHQKFWKEYLLKHTHYFYSLKVMLSAYYFVTKLLRYQICYYFVKKSLHKKWSFPLRIFSVNVTISAGNFFCAVNHSME